MIVFLVTPEHRYTHRKLPALTEGLELRITPYPEAFAAASLAGGTYVFTDLDRLSAPQLRAAAALYRGLRDAGCRVLNDPASVPSRHGLLRGLYEHGINDFNAYRVEEAVQPERWPVFVRLEGDHQTRASELLHDWDAVCRTVDIAIRKGLPIANLLIVEYTAEPVGPGLFRRLGEYRVGARQFPSTCVHQNNWWVKLGTLGIATDALYEDERRIMREDPHRDVLERVFALAGVAYGRADFGLVDGKPQIYEINTNPDLSFRDTHPNPARVETYRLQREYYLRALNELDSRPEIAPVTVSSRALRPFRGRPETPAQDNDPPRWY